MLHITEQQLQLPTYVIQQPRSSLSRTTASAYLPSGSVLSLIEPGKCEQINSIDGRCLFCVKCGQAVFCERNRVYRKFICTRQLYESSVRLLMLDFYFPTAYHHHNYHQKNCSVSYQQIFPAPRSPLPLLHLLLQYQNNRDT